jgi:hypothetical protein
MTLTYDATNKNVKKKVPKKNYFFFQIIIV